MKRVLFLVIFVFLASVLCPASGHASLINSVTVTASSSYYTMPVENIVNGSGLNNSNNPPTHSAIHWDSSWETDAFQSSAWVVFDLQQNTSVDSFRVWNFNMIQPGPVSFAGRGAKNVNVLTSADNSLWSTPAAYEFPRAPGTDDYSGVLFDDLGWQNVRYVKFDITSIWGDGDTGGHFGLSEVQFYTSETPGGSTDAVVPEPATMLLFGTGLIGAFLRKRIA